MIETDTPAPKARLARAAGHGQAWGVVAPVRRPKAARRPTSAIGE